MSIRSQSLLKPLGFDNDVRPLRLEGLMDLVAAEGPAELIRRVRHAQRQATPHPLSKRHDDAPVALCVFDQEDQ